MNEMDRNTSPLFQPLRLCSIDIPNRLMVSPMCQYAAGDDGVATDYHLVQLGRYALGGFGMAVVEATAVTRAGRTTHGDLGLWSDDQIPGLRRLAEFLAGHGTVPGIQIGHGGPKSSSQRPWEGNAPLGPADSARGDDPWQTVSVNTVPARAGGPAPVALDADGIAEVVQDFAAAARRAHAAGFQYLEVHAAHGYLIHQFLSPVTNTRTDDYGMTRDGRHRLLLEVVSAVRSVWPADLPLGVRISAVDGVAGDTDLADTVALGIELRRSGVNIIDCSSGGIGGAYQQSIHPGFQVPYAEAVRNGADIPTIAVGLILDPRQAEKVIAEGRADLVAVAREALINPNWAARARTDVKVDQRPFDAWHPQAAWWLAGRGEVLSELGMEVI